MSVRPSVLGAPETGEVRGEPLEAARQRGARAAMRLTFRLARQIGHHHVRDTYLHPSFARSAGCKGGGAADVVADLVGCQCRNGGVAFAQPPLRLNGSRVR